MTESRKCPACDYVGNPPEMFKHVANARRDHKYKTSAEVLVNAAGVESYGGGFRDVSGNFDVAGLDVEIRPSAEARRGGAPLARNRAGHVIRTVEHRVLVRCPTCLRKIPAGRMHQHVVVHGPRTYVCDVDGCSAAYGLSEHLRTHKKRGHSR